MAALLPKAAVRQCDENVDEGPVPLFDGEQWARPVPDRDQF